MNDRKLCGISVCITYVVLSILCLFLALSGLIPFSGLQRFLIDLPIIRRSGSRMRSAWGPC